MKLSHRVLFNRARGVDFRYPWQNRRLADEMVRLMRSSRGIGLAAPQCGISRRMFVMEWQGVVRQCFNPEICEVSTEQVCLAEGCLSFPGDQCTIIRPQWIKARYQDAAGTWSEEKMDGMLARCFLHELDHLEGITMWQRHKEQNAEQP